MTLIPIGRFSSMTRLSVKALRLYDKCELLPPARIDPATGYRYYSRDQAKRAEIIKSLRSVDMPLEEIRELLDARDGDAARNLLIRHRDRLAERLALSEQMLAHVESFIEHTERVLPYAISVTLTAPRLIAATMIHTGLDGIARHVAAGFATLVRGLEHTGASASGAPMLIHHDTIDEVSDGRIEICVPVAKTFVGDADIVCRELAGGSMATTLHRGPHARIAPAYHSLASWIADNGHEIAGPPREIYLNDPRLVAPADLLTQIEFPIDCEVDGGR